MSGFSAKAKLTFTRRFILVLCLSAIVMMVYLLAFYDPLIAAQKGLTTDLEDLKTSNEMMGTDTEIRKKAGELRSIKSELESELHKYEKTNKPISVVRLREELNKAFNEVSRQKGGFTYEIECGRHLPVPEDLSGRTDPSGRTEWLRLQGNAVAVFAFLKKFQDLECVPSAWFLEAIPAANPADRLFNLWMEVEP